MKVKSLFKSKTFWFNAFSAIVAYSGLLPMPPGALFYVSSAANIGLRMLTKGPVAIVTDAATDPL